MVRGIVRFSLSFRFLVIVIAGIIITVGIIQLPKMPVDILPEFSPPFVEIQTEALGLSAEEVEQMITVPMEQNILAGVAWMDVIRSESVPGLSSILIFFEPGTDLYKARAMVAERLTQTVALPRVSKPPTMVQPTSSVSRFMIVGLASDELSLIEMSVLARWTIAPRLLGVPGVANVAVWGNRDRQLQVQVDPTRLEQAGVTLNQIVETTGNALWVSPLSFLKASSPGAGGFIESPAQRLGIWHVLPISTPADLARVPIDGTDLTLGQVTTIVEDHQPLIGDAIVDDRTNLMLVIDKLPGANTLEVTKGVESTLGSLSQGLSEIKFDTTLYRPATFLETAISNISRAFVIGAVLFILAIGFLFYGWRTALIGTTVLVFSVIAAIYVLFLRGVTLNSMVLVGLIAALGIIIDESIVDTEHVMYSLRQNKAQGNPKPNTSVILEAVLEIRSSLFFATLILVLAIIPVFFIGDTPGALFRPLGLTYILAVAAATISALIITPVLTVILFTGGRYEYHIAPLGKWMQTTYRRILLKSLSKPQWVYGLLVILIIGGLGATPLVFRRAKAEPVFREPYITVRLQGAPATSRVEMDRVITRIGAELRTITGVQNVGAHVGRAVFGDEVVGINSAEMWVSVDGIADYDATVAAIRETVMGYPGLHVEILTYVQQSLDQPNALRTKSPYTVRVFGEDHQTLKVEAEKIREIMVGISGVTSSHTLLPIEEPTLNIEVDLAKAQRFGVKPGDVRRAAATLLSGIQVGSLFEEQKVFDVVVWSPPAIRESISDILSLTIDSPGGGHVLLGDVADVSIASAPVVIRREAASPYVDIGFEIHGRSYNAALADIRSALQNHSLPLDYHAEVMDGLAPTRAAIQNIIIAVLLALVGILLLLQAVSASWSLAVVFLMTMPMAFSGSILAGFLIGNELTLTEWFGLLTVAGITIRNGITMMSLFRRLKARDSDVIGIELILHGATEKLKPVLATTVSTGLFLLPILIMGNIPGFEIIYPMSIIIMGGLVTTALHTLFVVPVLYYRFGMIPESDPGLQASSPVGVPAAAQD